MDHPLDHELMLAVRDGDLDKLGTIFERYSGRLYNFFLRQTADPHASEDLVQDTFRRILESRHTYRAEGTFASWIFAIARSVHITRWRKHRHARNQDELTEDMKDPGPALDLELENRLDVSRLQQALARLPDDKREVLLMSRFENMKYEEIAEVAGCAIGTVKARIHRALKELSHIYRELGHEM
jgi:RNA polymerase sigma factor (sigma-70 family)